MAVPDYQSLMLPVLNNALAGEVRIGDVVEKLVDELGLSESDRAETQLRLLRHLLLIGPLAFRPGTLDVGPDRGDLFVVEDRAKSRHVAFVIISGKGLEPEFGDAGQRVVGMMPAMARCVMRRRGQLAVGKRRLPIGLSLEILAVATGATRGVKRLALGDLCLQALT